MSRISVHWEKEGKFKALQNVCLLEFMFLYSTKLFDITAAWTGQSLVVSTAASQQDDPGFESRSPLCEVCMFSPFTLNGMGQTDDRCPRRDRKHYVFFLPNFSSCARSWTWGAFTRMLLDNHTQLLPLSVLSLLDLIFFLKHCVFICKYSIYSIEIRDDQRDNVPSGFSPKTTVEFSANNKVSHYQGFTAVIMLK